MIADLDNARYGTLLLHLWKHVSPKRRSQLALLVLLMLLSGIAELATVASLMPFLILISNPSYLWNQSIVRWGAGNLGVNSPYQLAIPITLVVVTAGLLSAIIRTANLYFSSHLSALISGDLSVEGYRRTLEQPYVFHLSSNTSEVITRLGYLSLISRTILAPLLQGLAALIVSIVLLGSLFLYKPLPTATLISLFLLVYGALTMLNRRRIRILSARSAYNNQKALKVVQEGLGGIRDVLLDKSQMIFVSNYKSALISVLKIQANADTIAGTPKFILEALAILVISGISIWIYEQGNTASLLPILGTIALGFQRLLPALQQVYSTTTYLGAYRGALSDGLKTLEQRQASNLKYLRYNSNADYLQAKAFEEIELQNIGYSHESVEFHVKNISLSLRRGEWLGLIGQSGSGKSTLLDIIMGLLEPTTGNIVVNNRSIFDKNKCIDNRDIWQRHISHVPQSIFLADATITENIAFAVPTSKINYERLKWAASIADADHFINKLPDSYNTFVGERGMRLSGGQRQRIGIARALYKESELLILDEATSALDTQTEKRVIDLLSTSCKHLTVIMVAHRLASLERCNQIIELKDGTVGRVTTYDELINTLKPGSL